MTSGAPMRRRAGVRALAGAVVLGLVLAGCGRSGAGPTGAPASPGASVDGSALAASFVKILGDPHLHADVVQQATATAEQADGPLDVRATMTGVLALPDVDLELAVETEGQSTRYRVVVVDGRSYVDLGTGWSAADAGTVDTGELARAFVVVTDPADLAYAGMEVVGGRTLYHLVTTGPLPYTPSGVATTGAAAGTGTMDDMDAYVEGDGTPVRIQLSFTSTDTTASGPVTVHGTSEIRFSNVGGTQVVVAPSMAPSGSPGTGPSATP